MSSTRVLMFLSLLFAALALVPAGAHLAELPNKISLPGEEYLVVQQIYMGWALFGFVVFGALGCSAALAVALWRQARIFWPALVAFLSIALTQVVFWTFTFPANRATEYWTSAGKLVDVVIDAHEGNVAFAVISLAHNTLHPVPLSAFAAGEELRFTLRASALDAARHLSPAELNAGLARDEFLRGNAAYADRLSLSRS